MIEKLSHVARIALFKLVFSPVVKFVLGVKFRSSQKLAFDEPTIVVANHNSHLDAISIMCHVPAKDLDKVHPVVARDYFYRNALTKNLAKLFLNSVAVSRNRQYENPLKNVEALLEKGHSIIIFPEGSRGEPGKLGHFKHGVSKLLAKHPYVRYLPVYCSGLGEIMPKGDWLLIPQNAKVQFGAFGRADAGQDIPSITETIREAVMRLKN